MMAMFSNAQAQRLLKKVGARMGFGKGRLKDAARLVRQWKANTDADQSTVWGMMGLSMPTMGVSVDLDNDNHV